MERTLFEHDELKILRIDDKLQVIFEKGRLATEVESLPENFDCEFLTPTKCPDPPVRDCPLDPPTLCQCDGSSETE